MSGDFYQGYAIGHGAGVNKGGAPVDVESYREAGRVHEHGRVQAFYVKRLMRHLAARNSQKQALMRELMKYAPDHPYLNPETVETPTTKLLQEVSDPLVLQQVETSHQVDKERKLAPQITREVERSDLSRLLVDSTGGAVTTKGDLAMVADGVAFVAENMPVEEAAKIDADFDEFNPNIDESRARAKKYNTHIVAATKAADAAIKSAEKVAKAEKNERLKAEGVGFLSRMLFNHD